MTPSVDLPHQHPESLARGASQDDQPPGPQPPVVRGAHRGGQDRMKLELIGCGADQHAA